MATKKKAKKRASKKARKKNPRTKRAKSHLWMVVAYGHASGQLLYYGPDAKGRLKWLDRKGLAALFQTKTRAFEIAKKLRASKFVSVGVASNLDATHTIKNQFRKALGLGKA